MQRGAVMGTWCVLAVFVTAPHYLVLVSYQVKVVDLIILATMLGVDALRVSGPGNTVYQGARGVHIPGCSGQPPRVTWTSEEARGNKECLEKETVTLAQQSLCPSTVSPSTPVRVSYTHQLLIQYIRSSHHYTYSLVTH